MSRQIPASFVVRDLSAVAPSKVIDVNATLDVVENLNRVLGYQRRAHFAFSFEDGDIGNSVPIIQVRNTTITKTLYVQIPIITGHAKGTGGAGVVLYFMLAAEQDAAGANGSVEIKVLDTAAATLDTQTQAITQGAGRRYHALTTARLAPDTEMVVEARLTSGQNATAITLYQLSCREYPLADSDLP